jgi:quercetin dioxygenase-like cupin family protein
MWAPGRKQDLASLVSYHHGSVVSRTIINRKSGTVTLFAFDEGEGLSEHTAPHDALLHVLQGGVLVTIEGKVINLEEGEGLILPAGKPHSVKATRRFKMLLTMIRSVCVKSVTLSKPHIPVSRRNDRKFLALSFNGKGVSH